MTVSEQPRNDAETVREALATLDSYIESEWYGPRPEGSHTAEERAALSRLVEAAEQAQRDLEDQRELHNGAHASWLRLMEDFTEQGKQLDDVVSRLRTAETALALVRSDIEEGWTQQAIEKVDVALKAVSA